MSDLLNCRGVIHVGANLGQERDLYKQFDLDVLWFEPNPEIFSQLQQNISEYPKQKAYQFLITDRDDVLYDFNISNNEGQSSSIFQLYKHKDVWPTVHYVKNITVKSITLDTFMKRNGLDVSKYQKLHIDTQGADLLVLRGAVETLKSINYLQIEVSSLELYKGCCLENEVTQFLKLQGFKEYVRNDFIHTVEGTCSEINYMRV